MWHTGSVALQHVGSSQIRDSFALGSSSFKIQIPSGSDKSSRWSQDYILNQIAFLILSPKRWETFIVQGFTDSSLSPSAPQSQTGPVPSVPPLGSLVQPGTVRWRESEQKLGPRMMQEQVQEEKASPSRAAFQL